jgi:NAD(P)H-dependent FMN reductase
VKHRPALYIVAFVLFGFLFAVDDALLKAAAALAPEDVTLNLYDWLGDLPPFNPDLDRDPPHAAVAEFRFWLRKSVGLIISSPEYAHGVPGVLKNAIDWVVASGELYEKPVALFSASASAGYAQASLVETLTVITARVAREAYIVVPLLEKNLDENGIIADPDLSLTIRSALRAFACATVQI